MFSQVATEQFKLRMTNLNQSSLAPYGTTMKVLHEFTLCHLCPLSASFTSSAFFTGSSTAASSSCAVA